MNKALVASFIVIGIFIGIAFYFQERNHQQITERAKIYYDGARLEILQKEAQQGKLKECLQKAEYHYTGAFELNSSPNPQKDYPNARVWDNNHIMEETEANLRKDKEICIKLYK